MDDSAVVMARPGAGPDELAAVYDEHAAALYGYCRWLLPDPAQAVDALIEALASTTTRRDGPAEAGQLRARLYAAAREACRGHAAGTGAAAADEAAGDAADTAGLAEARRLLRDVLADMDQVTQQAAELSFRHQLDAAEIAIVLGVSPDQAGALTDRARQHLEKVVGALVVVRAGSSCPDLAALLAGQDETLTAATGKLAARHTGPCEQCAPHLPGELHPERLPALLPLPSLPDGLREPVLQQVAGASARRSRALGLLRRGGIRAHPGATVAVAAVLVWIVAAVTATAVTLSGRHTAHTLAVHQISVQAAASSSAAGGTPATIRASRSPSPEPKHRSAPAVASPVVSLAPASPVNVATPTPSYRASATAPASASPSASRSASPSPSPTRRRTPAPTPTDSGSASPSPSASRR